MQNSKITEALKFLQRGKISLDEAYKTIQEEYLLDLGYATIDYQREARVGYPEIVLCSHKTEEQVLGIIQAMHARGHNILATRATHNQFAAVQKVVKTASYNSIGRTITVINKTIEKTESYIAVVAAGTSDLPVVEEACVTAEMLGNRVEKIVDVGVAGIHRLFNKLELLRGAKVLIVVAGMEGALPSVVGGLVGRPIIAVPTSVGYGANLGGIAALLAMLNSCAGGVSVVNIDNGFGAAYQASMINKL